MNKSKEKDILVGSKTRFALIDKVEKAVEKLNAYRAAQFTAAVTGQIDVRKHGQEAR